MQFQGRQRFPTEFPPGRRNRHRVKIASNRLDSPGTQAVQTRIHGIVILVFLAACGTKPSLIEDEEHLLSGRWTFAPMDSEIFHPERMLLAQSDSELKALLEGELFRTRFQRIAVAASGPEAFQLTITFLRLETAQQYEVLSLTLDGRLMDRNGISGSYEIRGNLDSGGELRLEQGSFVATRQGTEAGRTL